MTLPSYHRPVVLWHTGFIFAPAEAAEFASRIPGFDIWAANSLLGGEAAINDQFRAGDVGRLIAGQEEDGVGDFLLAIPDPGHLRYQ